MKHKGEIVRLPTPDWLGAVANKVGLFKGVELEREKLGEWSAVTVGHWFVASLIKLNRRTHYVCVSACGVIGQYEPWQIAGGKLPKTCVGCRAGETAAPHGGRVVPESVRQVILQIMESGMATVFEHKHTLKAPEVIDEWHRDGKPVMVEIAERSGYGNTFGWKCFVHRCHNRSHLKSDKPRVRVRAVHDGTRRVELVCQPPGSVHEYEVDLYTGRTDHPWRDVADAIQRAVAIVGHAHDKSTQPVPVVTSPAVQAIPAPAPSANGKHVPTGPQVVDLAKLVRLRAGLETALTVGKEINELAAIKAEAAAKVEVARKRHEDTLATWQRAQDAAREARLKAEAHHDRVVEMERQLRNEMAARDAAQKALAERRAELEAADAAHRPTEQELKDAERELAGYEQLEADRLKQVGDAQGLAALLEALSKIPG